MCLFIRDSTSTVQGMPLRGSDIWPKPWGPRCIPGEGFSLQAAGIACAKALRSPVWHRVLVRKGRREAVRAGGGGGQRELTTGRNLDLILLVRGRCEHFENVMINLALHPERVTVSFTLRPRCPDSNQGLSLISFGPVTYCL